MGMRKEMRLQLALPVRVSGKNADGESFEQDCTTVDVTVNGLHVKGLTQTLRCGAVISVAHGRKSARVRVMWTGKTGDEKQGHAGLQVVGGWKNLWGRAISHIPGDGFTNSTYQREPKPDFKPSPSDDSRPALLPGSATDTSPQDAKQGLALFLSCLPKDGPRNRMAREPRLKLQLPVRVCGMSVTGRPFVENAITENVSRNGVCLTGLTCEVKKYDVLILSHQDRKGRFRVFWSKQHGTPPVFEFGLRALTTQSIWEVDFSGITDECVPVERRIAQRYICCGAASIWHPGVKHFVRGTVSDVSLSGCYVEVMTPLNVRDKVVLTLNINETQIRTPAEVRTSHPGMGMGLKFVDMTEMARSSMRALIFRLGHSGSNQIDVRAERRSREEVKEILDTQPQTAAIFDCATVQSGELA